MERLLERELLAWRDATARKPALIDGARQTGKTYLIEQIFGKRHFRKVHKLDFNMMPHLDAVFADGLSPDAIIRNIEIESLNQVDLKQDLIFFDEISECQAALDSLKYFAELAPEAFVCATGSNIGLLGSFPVGKVHHLELFPLCFEEFVMASAQPMLLDAFRARETSRVAHDKLMSTFLDYTFVGGMPEAVATWFRDGLSTTERVERVGEVHADLIVGYERDFGKYAGPIYAQHIHAVFQNIPRQLEATIDESVKRFRFKGIVPRRRGYRDLRGPIDWLEACRLAWKCYPIVSEPNPPLQRLTKESRFRLFLFDLGVLGNLLRIPYTLQRESRFAYKGFIAENFVQNELRVHVGYPTYGWAEGQAEIEFLHQTADGDIVPIEVKSSRRRRARSLSSYIARYSPARAIMLTTDPRGAEDGVVSNWPIYDAQFLARL